METTGSRGAALLRRVAAAIGQAADPFTLRESVRAIVSELYGAGAVFEPALRLENPSGEPLTAQDEEAAEIAGLYLDAAAVRLSQAFVDPLTGIANRRRFDETLQTEWARSARSQTPLCIVVLDVDFFGAYNERYGHQAGDEALKAVAKTVAEAARRHGDLAARYGGEEFAVILPDTTLEQGAAIAYQICKRVEELSIAHDWTTLGSLTLSCGVEAAIPASADVSAKTFVERADEALFRAKHRGRNRVVAGLQEEGGAANSRRYAVRHNLPGFAGAFVGRHELLREALDALRTCRLITVTGPGGAGKTRLACEIAAQAGARYSEGVTYVELTSAGERAQIINAIAHALRTAQRSDESLEESVFAQLAAGDRLLIFDNCEQALEACTELAADVLARCENVRILATSRITFGLPGERVLEIGPLTRDEASRLFRQRAPLGAATAHEAVLDRLWERMDALPLVVEVLAARSDDVAGADANAVMRTFREVVDWSYRLLDAQEKRFLRMLGAFSQSFDIRAAAAVAALAEDEALRLLQRLTHKSLVQFDPRAERFRLLELTRAFAREELQAAGEADDASARHFEHYRAAAFAIHSLFDESRVPEAVELTRANRIEIGSAVTFGASQPKYHAAVVEIVAYLGLYWQFTGQIEEASAYFAIADRCARRASTAARAHLAYAKAAVMYAAGDMKAVREYARAAVNGFEEAGERLWLAHARRLLAVGTYDTDIDQAERLLQQSLSTFRHCGHRGGTASALINLGVSMMDRRRDYSRARRFFEEALTIPGDGWSASRCVAMLNLSELAYLEGDYEKALSIATESCGTFTAIDNQLAVLSSLTRVAPLIDLGRYPEAAAALRPLAEAVETFCGAQDVCGFTEEVARLAWTAGDAAACLEMLGFRERYRSETETTARHGYAKRMNDLAESAKERLDPAERERIARRTANWTAQDALARAREVLAAL